MILAEEAVMAVMFDPYSNWLRLMKASVSMIETGLRAFATLGAAHEVMTARSALIDSAMRSPLTGDYGELGRMVPEKVDAFSRAGLAAANAWWAAQSAWMTQMQHLGGLAARGGPQTPAQFADLGTRMARHAVESTEATARAGAATLAPIHRSATGNARRLKGKRKKS
jgi:hypothetical protein